uniref:DUF295 domain-containing protein n=1 Tax=Syphacia muris TaxID=451379 RepID=A0A0N5ANU0_9BILA
AHGCGDPVLDSDNGFWVSKRNRHLSKPLDLKTLSTDFDFEGNLALFDKVVIYMYSMDEDCHHFRKSEEKNYKHYENVINDPTRVTSWTTASARCKLDDATHNLYTASRIATTGKGIKISRCTITKFFSMGIVINIFFAYVYFRFEVMVDELVILTSSLANPVLINRFVQHFSNRACKTVIFGEDSIAVDLPYVRHVSDANDLPDGDGRVSVILMFNLFFFYIYIPKLHK